MERAIVTGSNGFIGKNLVSEINGFLDVFEINEDIFNHENWYDILVRTFNDINPSVVFHVGACSNTLETDVNYMMTRNYQFTKIITDLCFVNQVALIYSSSAANYGTNNIYPSNLYGWSKYVAEDYVLGNGGIALRYFNVYGPHESEKGKMSSVAYQMLQKHKNGEEIKLFPKKPTRDFVYIKDVVSANIYAYKKFDEFHSLYFEVGSGESRSFEDVLNILEIPYSYYDESEIPKGYQFYTKSEPLNWLDGWEPKYNLEKGLKEYKLWINQQS